MKYFGTDGIRGKFGDEFVSESFFKRLGQAVSVYLSKNGKKKLAIAGDTRFSSEILKKAFCDGLKGVNVIDLGCLSTPALAFGVIESKSDLGVMITASHNPYTDNGIKFFDEKAQKISDEAQNAIEDILDQNILADGNSAIIEKVDMRQKYMDKMCGLLPKDCLKGLTIALDCANGATVGITGKVLSFYGAKIVEIGNAPDGKNINDGIGSEHPEKMAKLVVDNKAFLGFAHDGDGDRLVVCDENGVLLSGEAILGLIALSGSQEAIVTTLQSNTGLDESLAKKGVKVYRSDIGDRLVMQMMLDKKCMVGGENSGHYIFLDVSPCGDGLAAAIKFLQTILNLKIKASEINGIITLYPLEQKAIKVAKKIPVEETKTLKGAVSDCEKLLAGRGRVFVRYSGTENKIRLLVESPSSEKNLECMKILQNAVENDLQ